ncbi:hypothetical protein PVAP13_7NG136317 [Panicum virgatum]|uniref:Uncharacterized protein n=1 Tax=Panicum virgatum TaxID=38727 RepID=A0A8T0PVR8_PANVG|nr:hypothetical protein PVAP13_7NG136317 [Panicum virgatum]
MYSEVTRLRGRPEMHSRPRSLSPPHLLCTQLSGFTIRRRPALGQPSRAPRGTRNFAYLALACEILPRTCLDVSFLVVSESQRAEQQMLAASEFLHRAGRACSFPRSIVPFPPTQIYNVRTRRSCEGGGVGDGAGAPAAAAHPAAVLTKIPFQLKCSLHHLQKVSCDFRQKVAA